MSASTDRAVSTGHFIHSVGQGVEIDLFGRSIPGRVIRATNTSAAVSIPEMSDVRDLRIGVRVPAVFAATDGAVEIICGLGAMRDYVALTFLSEPKLVQRRRYERIKAEVPVELVWRDHTAGDWGVCPAITQDVSAGGARLTLVPGSRPEPPVPAAGLVVLICVTGVQDRIETAARVLDVNGSQIRMEFIDPPKGFVEVLMKAARP